MATPISLSGYRPFQALELARAKMRAIAVGAARSEKGAAAPTAGPFRPGVYAEIEVEVSSEHGACWCWMAPIEAPSFTPGLLRDMASLRVAIRQAFAANLPGSPAPLKQLVLGSRIPGIFNLGGDLERFTGWIRAQDRDRLTAYAYACIDVLHDNAVGFDQPIITIALVQGDALGGGFETALSCHMIVAERGAKFGLPEIMFNLFPGMGACSLLTRRLGAAKAEQIIASGKIYTAEELHALGLVHTLAEPGDGVAETHRLLTRNVRRHNGLSAMHRAGRRVQPLPYDELRDIADIWVDAALKLEGADLRKMERLTVAQNRRLGAGGFETPAG